MDWMDDYLGGRSPGTAAGLLHISRMKLSCYRRARSGAHSQRASFVRREIKRFVMRTECAHSAWHRTETARRIKPSKRDKINASSLLSQLHCGSLFFCLPQIPPVRSLLVRSLYDFALPIRCCADVACTLCKNQYSVYLFLGERLCFPHRFCPFAIILRFVSSAGRFTFVI